jgi:ribonuclease-3
VAERLELPRRMRQAAPAAVRESAAALVETERVLASVTEAVIGACYLNAGYERTAEAVVEAFEGEIERALQNPVDFKSALQELLARRGAEVSYEVTAEEGPPHARTYTVTACVDGRALGSGSGRSKKHAEQQAARVAVEQLVGQAGG